MFNFQTSLPTKWVILFAILKFFYFLKSKLQYASNIKTDIQYHMHFENTVWTGIWIFSFLLFVNCSLNWQHQLCKNPRPNPDIKTLFVDHTCAQPNGARAPSPANNPLLGSLPKAGGFPPLGAHGVFLPRLILTKLYLLHLMWLNFYLVLLLWYEFCLNQPFQPTPAPVPTPLAGWMSNPSVTHPAVSGGPIGLGGPSIPGRYFSSMVISNDLTYIVPIKLRW